MADSHSSSASSQTPPIQPSEVPHIATMLNDLAKIAAKRGDAKYAKIFERLASSLAELVADSARLDWMQSQAEGQDRAMRWWVRGAPGATVHCCYDRTEPVKPEHETKFSRLFTEHSKPTLREAIDGARSLPETTDNG